MIALCGEHHAKADAGAFTKEQLRAMKSNTAQAREISGKFDWMRQQLLGVVGGNFYFETHAPAIIQGMKPVSFGTDEAGHWLLDVDMLTVAREPRLQVTENFWISCGTPQDVECPPSGKALAVKYANGDKIRIEFVPDLDMSGLVQRYPGVDMGRWELPSPITVVEVEMVVAGTDIKFGSRSTQIGGVNMTNCFMRGGHCGMLIG
jgi:hypothetical protein